MGPNDPVQGRLVKYCGNGNMANRGTFSACKIFSTYVASINIAGNSCQTLLKRREFGVFQIRGGVSFELVLST